MRNLVIVVILAGVLGYFGAKFYLHHEVSSGLDSAITLIRPYADFRYSGVSSNLMGELSIEGISARFGNFKDCLEIDRVSVITPSFWHLLKLRDLGGDAVRSGDALPDSLGFAMQGMHATVSDDFMKTFLKAARQASHPTDDADIGAQGIGKYGFSMADLNRPGYDDITMSLSMHYRRDRANYWSTWPRISRTCTRCRSNGYSKAA